MYVDPKKIWPGKKWSEAAANGSRHDDTSKSWAGGATIDPTSSREKSILLLVNACEVL